MPRSIDLDARRAQREPVTVTASGKSFELPPFLPAYISVSMMKLFNATANPEGAVGGMREAYAALFGEERADEAMQSIGMDELQVIMEDAYGVNAGELSASPSS